MVIYIDIDGGGSGGGVGFTGTGSFTDTGDGCRRAISGYAGGSNRATLNFASGFKADYAICMDTSYAGLWKLVSSGSHTFISSLNRTTSTSGHYEMDLTLANLGLAPGSSFDYVATYLNPSNASRSNEFNGVASFSGDNPDYTTVNLAPGDYHTFISYPAEVLPASNGGNGPGGVGYTNGSSSLELWLRADRGVYEDTACSDAAENNEDVTCWGDQSGYGRNHTQSTTGNQPNYFTGAQNGLPVIRFNGSSDRLTNSSAALAAGDDTFTYFSSWMSDVSNAFRVVYEQNHTLLQTGKRACLIITAASTYGFNGESNDFHNGASYTAGQYQVSSMVLNGASSNNVVVTGNGTSNTGSINITTQNISADGGTAVGYKITATNEFFDGDIPEVIVFSDALPDVERILVENYLSAKYDVALTAEDHYDGDTSANGEFDYDVAGIGMYGGNTHVQAHSNGMIVRNVTFLQGNSDWLLFGHNVATNNNTTADLPTSGDWSSAPDPMRWLRSFYIDVTDSGGGSGGTVDIIFDLSEGGMGAPLPAGPASNYRLLGRSGTSGNFEDKTASSGATVAIVGDQVQFLGVDVNVLGSNFTLGTLDYNNSPTSVELLDLNARPSASALPIALLGGAAVLLVSAGLLLRRRAR